MRTITSICPRAQDLFRPWSLSLAAAAYRFNPLEQIVVVGVLRTGYSAGITPASHSGSASQAYAVMLLDYLAGENVLNACSGEIKPATIGHQYIGAAVEWLRNEARVDAARVHIVAWSLGGAGLLDHLAQLSQADPIGFRSAIAIYPGCGGPMPWRVALPVLFLLGDADDIAPPSLCANVIEGVRSKELVTVRRYPDARHGFDNDDAPEVVATARGTTVGFNAKAARASWEELLRFIAR